MFQNLFKKNATQFFVYCIIGFLNTVVHYCGFMGSIVFLKYQSMSNLFGFILGVSVSFYLNGKFNFKKELNKLRFLKMVCASGSLSFIFGFLGDSFSLDPNITFVIYVLFNPIFGFILTKYYVFK